MDNLKTVEKISMENKEIRTKKEFVEAFKEIMLSANDMEEAQLMRNVHYTLDQLILHYEYKDLANQVKIKGLLEGA